MADIALNRSTRLIRSSSASLSTRRCFHYSAANATSPLFQLGALSTSRESQYLSKATGIPRTAFSPSLELIKSSEVDPYKKIEHDGKEEGQERSVISDISPYERSLAIGRAILEHHREEIAEQKRLLGLQIAINHHLEKELAHSRREKSQATLFAMTAILLAAAFATWQLKPDKSGTMIASRMKEASDENRSNERASLGERPQFQAPLELTSLEKDVSTVAAKGKLSDRPESDARNIPSLTHVPKLWWQRLLWS